MELKSTLQKPYTEEQWTKFIIEQNRRKRYEIRETETELQAWGIDDNELFDRTKEAKNNENDTKAKAARYTQEFTLTIQGQECVFDTSDGTQKDLNTAALYCLATQQTYDDWVTNNGIHLNLTLEDISLIAQTFKEKSNVYLKWDEYRIKIKNAKTVAGLNRIKIEY